MSLWWNTIKHSPNLLKHNGIRLIMWENWIITNITSLTMSVCPKNSRNVSTQPGNPTSHPRYQKDIHTHCLECKQMEKGDENLLTRVISLLFHLSSHLLSYINIHQHSVWRYCLYFGKPVDPWKQPVHTSLAPKL